MRGPISVRIVVFGLFACAGVAFSQPLPPQPPGPLDRSEVRRQVAEQEASAQVRDAIAQADLLARSHPQKASWGLVQLRIDINSRNDLGSAKKDALHDQLTAAINGVNRVGAKTPANVDARLILRNDQNRKALDAAQAEAKEVQEAVAAITKDEADGRLSDARARVAGLVKKYPTNPAAAQLAEIGMVRANLTEAKFLSDEMSRRFVKNMNLTDAAALPIVNDMEFPKDWAEITKRREKLTRVTLGAEEESLLRALETPITVPMKGQPFEEVIQTLSNAIGKNLYIDQKSFENLGLDMRKPVDVPGGVSARTALRAMLQSVGMTFVIRDKIIKVVSVEEARKNMMTRSYEIRDLIQSGGPFNGGATWGPYVDYLQTQKNAEMLLESIKLSVDPNAWSDRGGPSSILFHYPTMSIVVRAPSEVQYSLGLAMYGKKK